MTTQAEREKYIRAWAMPAYRVRSPGERLLPHFLNWAKPPATLIDLGCGTGRASALLKTAGFDVTMLDITHKAVDPLVIQALPFVEACLWDMPFKAAFDYFYCTDVMEHIPPEHVDAVLDNVRGVAKAGFFQIALFPETFAKVIGTTPLHQTVREWDWWADKIADRWKRADFVEYESQRLCAFVA